MKVIYVVNGTTMCYKCCLSEAIRGITMINPIAIGSVNSGIITSCIRCGKILGNFDPDEIQRNM